MCVWRQPHWSRCQGAPAHQLPARDTNRPTLVLFTVVKAQSGKDREAAELADDSILMTTGWR